MTLAGLDLSDEQLNALFGAGCDDATFSLERDGSVLGFFDRDAETQEDAVLSALDDVEGAGVGARVLRVTQDDDWLTASEIAERVDRSRQSIRHGTGDPLGSEDRDHPATRLHPTGAHQSLRTCRGGSRRTKPGP